MRRLALVSVIALTLTVTATSFADTSAEAPTAAAAKEPAPPVVAAPAPAAAAKAPVVSPTPAPTVAPSPAPTVAPSPAPTVAPSPAPWKAGAAPVLALAPATPPAAAVASAVVVAAPAPAPALASPAAPAKEAEPPLALRPSKELTLAPEPAHIAWPYKLIFGVIVLAAAMLVWKKRRALTGKPAAGAAVRVLSRTSTGLRGELALVEVGGMRMLIGITPGSMQTLAILPDESADLVDASLREEQRAAAARPRSEAPTSELAARARSLFSSLDLGPAVTPRASIPGSSYAASRYADERDIDPAPESAPAPAATRSPRRRTTRELPLEGQARGLALALGKTK